MIHRKSNPRPSGRGGCQQPKGTSDAGRFAPKAGAGDDDDLHEDSFPGMYRPRCMPGNWLGGGFAPPTKDGFDVDPYMRSDAGGVRADADDMAEFRKALPVRPMAMSDREYGEAATRKRKGAPSFRAGVVEVCQDA